MNKPLTGADYPPTRVQDSSCQKLMLAYWRQSITEQKRNDGEQQADIDPETPVIISDG